MPRTAQVSLDGIVQTARSLIEQDGYENLTLARLGQALGIKAPSLYKHVADKSALIRLVNLDTWQRLTAAMYPVPTDDLFTQLASLAHQYRAFALAHPTLYTLTMNEVQPDPALLEALVIPFQRLFEQHIPADRSLSALRGLWALTHGFVVLEISQRFRRGGSLDAAFSDAVQAYLMGWGVPRSAG